MFTCKDCSTRKIGCHSTCEKYQREKTEHDNRRKAAENDKSYVRYLCGHISECKDDAAIRRKKYNSWHRR